MVEKPNLSVDEILAACRASDGSGGEAVPAASTPPEVPQGETASPPASAAPPQKAAEMSVAEMLAAARSEKGGAGGGQAAPPAAAEAAAKPATTVGKKPGAMSVAEMLAAARGEKSAAAPAAKPAPQPAAKGKPAAKAAKRSPQPAAGPQPKDTSSILAAARKATKPGPISKAEAAARQAPAGAKAKPRPVAPPMPEKPAYAKPAPRPAKQDETRRGFFTVLFGSFLAVGFLGLGAVSLLWGLGLARFMFPNILTEPPSKFKVGFPDNFPAGSVATKYKAQFGVWVVNAEYEGQPMITALKTVCTHLGCTPNWLEGEQKFKCPCHGSGFYKDGVNFEGPAPRPLERYAIRVADDGQLEIDKSRTFQQEMGQWNDSASYVPV